jgi:BirA family biotin operon repressor/biotin-[acetyl-CoA-carboxylase] ligase
MSFGHPHHHFRVTTSTNSRARELAECGAPGGTVVSAEEQTDGRGRGGRRWAAPPGGALLYSAILRPLDQRHRVLALATSLAVCEAAEELAPDASCQIKWPNDVQLGGRKLAGILIEARVREGWAVIGVGLNLAIEPAQFPAQIRPRATSLGGGATAEEARAALNRWLSFWSEAQPAAVIEAWSRRDALSGQPVRWEGGSGIASGVDQRGSLVVIAANGRRLALSAGEVHLLST